MDLKSFREDKLKLTQEQFAELLEVEQSQISRWESKPDSIGWPIIQKMLEKTGASLEELTGWKKPIPKPIEIDNSWLKADFTKRSLSDYISSALENANIPEEQCQAYVNDLRDGIAANIVKPQVTIVGRSDTGKSTLINALLGSNKMPTAWTPTTSIAVYIKHISDKPIFIEEDVWVFKNRVGDDDLWNERRLYDEEYCRQWKIGAGGADILRSFGTRQGENYEKNAGSAVMFIDSPILNTCDIVDLPGFGTETESDDNITFKATQRADVIVYLSQANGFMRIEDITYLKRNISELPVWEKKGNNNLNPLANLFIVASQAHTISNGNREQLKGILDVGCTNLLKTLSDGYWTSRQTISGYKSKSYGENELRSRFFSYTTDISDICTPFNEALKEVLETLPVIINERAKAFVADYVKTRKPNLINELKKYEGIVAERDKYILLLGEIDKNELARVQENDKRKKDVRAAIQQLHDESISEFSEYCAKTINTDAIVQLLKSKSVKNKKDEVELFGSSLQSMIQEQCETILSEKSERLSEKTKNYITAYSESVSRAFTSNSINVDFDAGWAFASALSKLGLIGGLGGFLASTISGVMIFTGIGISIGSSIGLGILTSSIFGPIGIAAGLLIAGTMGLIKLFGGGWEKSVAKKIVSLFDEKDINGKFRNGIREYWTQTEEAFDHAAAVLDDEWSAYVKNLRDMIEDYDINDIQHKIASLKVLSCFFDNIPL